MLAIILFLKWASRCICSVTQSFSRDCSSSGHHPNHRYPAWRLHRWHVKSHIPFSMSLTKPLNTMPTKRTEYWRGTAHTWNIGGSPQRLSFALCLTGLLRTSYTWLCLQMLWETLFTKVVTAAQVAYCIFPIFFLCEDQFVVSFAFCLIVPLLS